MPQLRGSALRQFACWIQLTAYKSLMNQWDKCPLNWEQAQAEQTRPLQTTQSNYLFSCPAPTHGVTEHLSWKHRWICSLIHGNCNTCTRLRPMCFKLARATVWKVKILNTPLLDSCAKPFKGDQSIAKQIPKSNKTASNKGVIWKICRGFSICDGLISLVIWNLNG